MNISTHAPLRFVQGFSNVEKSEELCPKLAAGAGTTSLPAVHCGTLDSQRIRKIALEPTTTKAGCTDALSDGLWMPRAAAPRSRKPFKSQFVNLHYH